MIRVDLKIRKCRPGDDREECLMLLYASPTKTNIDWPNFDSTLMSYLYSLRPFSEEDEPSLGATSLSEPAEGTNDNEKKSDYDVALENLKAHFVKNKLTYQCLENTAKLLNSMPGVTVQLPTTKYSLLKAFLNSDPCEYHVYCRKCKEYIKCLPRGQKTEKWACETLRNNRECGQSLICRDKQYFVYIKLKEQLKKILENHWDEIVTFSNTIQSDESENIRDTYSGKLIQNSLRKNFNLLSLMINSDGICLKKSGTSSVWPLQVICNFLPPEIRFRNENILCVAFFYQQMKPDMLDFCKPFAEEIEQLQTKGFVFRDQVFRAAITCAVLDLPAKASFQQLIQYNGYFGCGYCMQRGEQTGKGVRFTWNEECCDIRTHRSFLLAMGDISMKKLESKDGIIGVSPAVSFDYFDMVDSFGLDYMHCVCLGIEKNLIRFWTNSKAGHDSYITLEYQQILNKRIMSIKPCVFISRLPRSLKYHAKFKASERRSLILYYLPVVLRGMLEKKYLDHFYLLSGSIYKLLTTNISAEDLNIVENDLKQFVKEYEVLYGKENMTMNVHLLSHMVSCVKNLGPLWTQSMFAFESNNATFSRYVKGNNDIIAELRTKYLLHKSVSQASDPIKKTSNILEYKKKIKLSQSELGALTATLNISVDRIEEAIYCVFKKNEERFTSVNYSAAVKTIDYMVELNNKLVGKVKFYFQFENVFYALLEEYEYVGRVLHLRQIAPTNIHTVFSAEKIEKKFIYINSRQEHFITERPNQFESD